MTDLDPFFHDTCEPILRVECEIGSTYTNPCACNSYYQCITGYEVIARNCSTGLWWSHLQGICIDAKEVSLHRVCIQKESWKSCNVSDQRLDVLAAKCGGVYVPVTTTSPPVTKDPIFQDSCEPLDLTDCDTNTTHIDPCACDSYYTCGKGDTITNSKCPDGTSWHHNNSTCVSNDVINDQNICSTEKPWDRCKVTDNRLSIVSNKCGYKAAAPSSDNSTWIIVGVVGILLVLLIIGGLFFLKKRKDKKKRNGKGKMPVMNPEYFDNNDSIYNTINDRTINDPMNEDNPTYMGDSCHLSLDNVLRSSTGPPYQMAPPIPSIQEHKIESEPVEYDNPGLKSFQSRSESTNLNANDEHYVVPEGSTPERYLQLSDTYKIDAFLPPLHENSIAENVLNAEVQVILDGYLMPDSEIDRPNSETRVEKM